MKLLNLKHPFSTLFFSALLLVSTSEQVLSQVYATSITVLSGGRDGYTSCCGWSPLTDGLLGTNRNPNNALGAPQCSDVMTLPANNNYYALGFGGSVQLTLGAGFSNGPGNDLTICETTFGVTSACAGLYPDKVTVYASQDNCSWTNLGTYCDAGLSPIGIDLGALTWAKYVRLTDASIRPPNTSANNTQDGFDLDGVIGINALTITPALPSIVSNASSVESYTQGLRKNGTTVTAASSIVSKTLGAPQNTELATPVNYFTLGFGGQIVLKLSSTCYRTNGTNEIVIYESSNSGDIIACASNPEKASVYGSLNGTNWVLLNSSICMNATLGIPANSTLSIGGAYGIRYLKITDVSNPAFFASPTADGFDLDGVSVRIGCPAVAFRLAEETSETSSLDSETQSTELSIYPNPASSVIKTNLTLPYNSNVTFLLYDYSGKLVKTQSQIAPAEEEMQQTINIEDLPDGVYLLIAQTDQERIVKRFLKQSN
jgi:hypothetical protein